jgi:predicted ATP-grasp superfamily ATP-dependent carboligase
MMTGKLSPAQYLRVFRQPMALGAFALDDPLPGLVDLPISVMRWLTARHSSSRSLRLLACGA